MPTLVKNKNWMNEFMTLKTQYNLNNITEETLLQVLYNQKCRAGFWSFFVS